MKSSIFLSTFLVIAGFAQFSYAEEGIELCREDVQKFCKDIKPGEARIMRCLKEHHDQLSPACKAKGTEMSEKMKEMRKEMGAEMKESTEACKADREKFCKDVKMGEGRIMDCMMSHKEELSPACKEMHGKMKGHRKGGMGR